LNGLGKKTLHPKKAAEVMASANMRNKNKKDTINLILKFIL
jgi:hypothetical protein